MSNDNLSAQEIVKISQSYLPVCGIYFLIQGEEIVYVGQSIDIFVRVAEHANGPKEFDRYACIEVDPDRLGLVEADYIVALDPKYNSGNLPSYERWVTLKFITRLLKDTPYTLYHAKRHIEQNNIKSCNGYYLRSDFGQLLNVKKERR